MDTETVQPDTADAFDAAVSVTSTTPDVPETPGVVETPEAETPAEQATRDEKGRFAKGEAEPAKVGKPRDDPRARVEQATAKEAAAKRDAAEARAEAARYRAELEAVRRPAPERTPEPAAPRGETFPDYATYLQAHPDTSLEDYIDTRADWRDAQRQTARQREASDAEAKRLAGTREQALLERISTAHKDNPAAFDAIDPRFLSTLRYGALPPEQRKDATFGHILMEQVFQLSPEHPVELLTHLSSTTELQRLATLPPEEIFRELAKLDARFGAASSPSETRGPAPSAKPVSQATAPIKPLGTSPPAPDPFEITDDLSVEEHIRRGNALDRKQRRGAQR